MLVRYHQNPVCLRVGSGSGRRGRDVYVKEWRSGGVGVRLRDGLGSSRALSSPVWFQAAA